MRPTAGRLRHLTPHYFSALGERLQSMQAEGIDVIRLDEGSPDLPPAPFIIEALALAAAHDDGHGYQSHAGPSELRKAWMNMYRRLYSVELDPDSEITPLLGSKEGIFHLNMVYVDLGDIVLVPDPGYVTYRRGALFAGGEVYPMPLVPDSGYLPDLEAIPTDILHRSKLMWLNYPSNPTTGVAPIQFFAQAVEMAEQYNLLLCHDSAYSQVTFDGKPSPSLLQVSGARDVAVEFNTLSKSHNMAGWRTGALLGNAQAVGALRMLKTNLDSSHFQPVFEATIAALNGDQTWLQKRNEIYRRRRDVVIEGLHSIGLDAKIPTASIYVWSPVPQGWTCEDYVSAALEHTAVSMTPGTVFGPGGEGFIRIALTATEERTEEGMRRLKDWMGKWL